MTDLLLSLGVVAAVLLIGAGVHLLTRGRERRRAWLMIGAGAVTLLNVWLWATMPAPPPA